MAPAAHKPDGPAYDPATPTPAPLLHPERAEIQARRPDPVTYSPIEGPTTDLPDQHGVDYDAQDVGKVESVPHSGDVPDQYEVTDTTASVTPTPILPKYDAQDFTKIELPPLPTTRTKTPYLDISHGEKDGGQPGSDQGEQSGSGDGDSSDDSTSRAVLGAAVTPTQVPTSRSSWLLESSTELKEEVETTSRPSQLLQITLDHVIPDDLTTELGVTAGVEQLGQDPAVVFKEHDTTGATLTLNLSQSLDMPVGRESTAKSPIHVIMVNVLSKNQSGE